MEMRRLRFAMTNSEGIRKLDPIATLEFWHRIHASEPFIAVIDWSFKASQTRRSSTSVILGKVSSRLDGCRCSLPDRGVWKQDIHVEPDEKTR